MGTEDEAPGGWEPGTMSTALVHDALVAEMGEAAAAACVLMTGGALVPTSACHGPAHTITIRRAVGDPGTSVGLRQAYDLAPSGSVVVVSVVGDVGGAVVGDIIGHRLRVLSVAGLVVDGHVRDTRTLSDSGLAVWSRGVSMRGVISGDVSVTVNHQTRCGAATIFPGDLIAADDDGVVCVPAAVVDPVLARCRTMESAEREVHVRLSSGNSLVDVLGGSGRSDEDPVE